MKKLKLCNVHKLALSNEGEQRKPIHIPFGTWAYDDTCDHGAGVRRDRKGVHVLPETRRKKTLNGLRHPLGCRTDENYTTTSFRKATAK